MGEVEFPPGLLLLTGVPCIRMGGADDVIPASGPRLVEPKLLAGLAN